jgi:hypothetical protein
MQLIFTSINSNNQRREFSWWLANLEIICDVLNSIVSKGNQLISAEIVDGDQRTQLSVEAFDGSDCSGAIRQLRQEWQQILSAPVSSRSVHNQRLIGLTQRQVKNHEGRIAQIELAIKALEQQRQQVQNHIFREPSRSVLMSRNEEAIQQFQLHLTIAQARQQTILNKLDQLQKSAGE